jgi:tetratricopeptide (TPR) repeat protein
MTMLLILKIVYCTASSGSRELWKTIHPRWDMKLIAFLHTASDLRVREKRARYLENAIYSIGKLGDDMMNSLVILAMYDIGAAITEVNIVDGVGSELHCTGRYENIAKMYEQALKEDPIIPKALYNKGNNLFDSGRYEEALKSYEKALKINPDYSKALYSKAGALMKLGRYEEALSYEKAIELDPNSVNTWYAVGNALSLEMYGEALVIYDKALELDPKLALIWYNKGLTLHEPGRDEESEGCFYKAKELGLNI